MQNDISVDNSEMVRLGLYSEGGMNLENQSIESRHCTDRSAFENWNHGTYRITQLFTP